MEMGLELVSHGGGGVGILQAERLLVGWYDSVYDEELGSQPCIFTSVTPVSSTPSSAQPTRTLTGNSKAWNNINLTRLAEKIKSPLVL